MTVGFVQPKSPSSNKMVDVMAIPAVSERRIRGPNVKGITPMDSADLTSVLSKPPSGPINILTPCFSIPEWFSANTWWSLFWGLPSQARRRIPDEDCMASSNDDMQPNLGVIGRPDCSAASVIIFCHLVYRDWD